MTDDELFQWTCKERNALKVEARQLRLDNAALSVKLEDRDEQVSQLENAYESAEAARKETKAKLEEVEKERNRLLAMIEENKQRAYDASDAVEASRGEIVTPQPICSGPFSDARDCPVHAPSKVERGEVVTACPQWQPIETAPTNTFVLIFDPTLMAPAIAEKRVGQPWPWFYKPTHWMPLPEAPQS